MGAPRDRVRVFKLETPAGGTQDDEGFQSLAIPNQDAPSVQGFFLQKPLGAGIDEDEFVYVTRDDAGNIVFRDIVLGSEVTLTALVGGAPVLDRAWRRHFLLMGA